MFTRWSKQRKAVRFPRVQVLDLAPNDILVVECPTRLSTEQAEDMRSALAEATGHDGRRVIAITNLALRVIREGDPPPPPVIVAPGGPF